jgi:hypothetical protein
MTDPDPIDNLNAADIRSWRSLPRAARRAAWRQANRLRDRAVYLEDGAITRTPRMPWMPHPSPSPLQAHMRTGRAGPYSQNTLGVSLGFNRAARRAMRAKSGPKAPSYKIIRRHVKQRRTEGVRQGDGYVVQLNPAGFTVRAGRRDRTGGFVDRKALPPVIQTSVIDRPTQPYRLNKFALQRALAVAVADQFKQIRADQTKGKRMWRAFLRWLLKAARLFQSLTPWLNRRSK